MGKLRTAGVAIAAAVVGCAAGTWDFAGLEARHPTLRGIEGQRLGDAMPYVWPWRGELRLFLCRWPIDAPIPVSLPAEASGEERDALILALRAWESAGLGVRFAIGAPRAPNTGIDIAFLGEPEAGSEARSAGSTIADCSLTPEAFGTASAMAARLVFASIQIQRVDRDFLGRPIPLGADELVGSVLHEIGHALGFQGHAQRGSSVMVRTVESVRRAGRRVRTGRRFEDSTLRALYSVPSGTVVGRAELAPFQTDLVERMTAAARRRGFAGPLVRVGGTTARFGWRDEAGRPYALLVFGLDEAIRRPERFRIQPAPRAEVVLRDEAAR